MRHYTLLDHILFQVDAGLASSFNRKILGSRPIPGNTLITDKLTPAEKKNSASLMRVNHAGEVCAQALYRAQALTAKSPETQAQLEKSANEEMDHLAWCQERLTELDSRPSYLSCLWYSGSFLIGLVAGAAGDRWSLGFLAETEHQVGEHLQKHLQRMPVADQKSAAILEQMADEEYEHQQTAHHLGATELPAIIKMAMRCTSKLMTTLAYYI